MKKIGLLAIMAMVLFSGCANGQGNASEKLLSETTSIVASSSDEQTSEVISIDDGYENDIDDGRETSTVTMTFTSTDATTYGTYSSEAKSYTWTKDNFILENTSLGKKNPGEYANGSFRFYVKSKLFIKVTTGTIKYVTFKCDAEYCFDGLEEYHNCKIKKLDDTTVRLYPLRGYSKVSIYNANTINVKKSQQRRIISATLVYYVA